ncbi:MAG TPA: ATP-binding cassette domain-containing protein [Verrucomicrobiae bacterium]|jgi:phospholipid/cholesterol/gamma-HCH transport system ATP-binding protein|nr:ATP-binding cassette domain-containing protein [Verrucomicrobiae bacterium]
MSADNSHSESVKVEVRDLRKCFGLLQVLKGVSFTVNPGELFVVMGPSGGGKSVLLKHIIGLITPDSGEILIEGESILSSDVRTKFRMAMVFQSAALLTSLSVGENVGLYLTEHQLKPPAEIATIVSQKLDVVGLKGIEKRSPGELSGGMQKRVAIARALVVEPQLVLFDEPTSELDPLMAVAVGEEILKLNNRTHATTIVVTHDREFAFAVADRIAVIDEGRILFIGTPGEVKSNADPRIQKFIRAELTHSKQ